jgi:hypothetical protein
MKADAPPSRAHARAMPPRTVASFVFGGALASLGLWGCLSAGGVSNEEAFNPEERSGAISGAARRVHAAQGQAVDALRVQRGACVRQADRLTGALEDGYDAARLLSYGVDASSQGRAALLAWRAAESDACGSSCAFVNEAFCAVARPVRDALEGLIADATHPTAWEELLGRWEIWRAIVVGASGGNEAPAP